MSTAVFLFVTNFPAGTTEVYDNNYEPATTDGGFIDRNIPRLVSRRSGFVT